MCGIAGIIGPSSRDGDAAFRVESMVTELHHRGPDHQQVDVCKGAVLGHARLSIIDLSGGNQPIYSPDGRVSVVFNGEIYNYIELKRDLLADYPFRTESDTEVIVALYLRLGIDFIQHLNGQFAICLHDERNGKSYLIRDRIGIAPLYYRRRGEDIEFASEIKSFRALDPTSLELNPAGLADFIHLWAPITPETLYRDILEVSPGCYLELGPQGVQQHRYWDFVYEPEERPLPELIEELDALMEDAVRIRLRSDVPVAAYLSGGLDSSIILSYLMRSGIDLETFSLTFADEDLNEAPFQQEVAQWFGTRHNELHADYRSIADAFVDTIWHAESPLFRSSPTPMKLLSGRVHESGYKVVLTGEGADENFAGYDIFKEARIRAFWNRNPDSRWRPQLLRRLYPYLDFSRMNSSEYLKNAFGHNLQAVDTLLYSHAARMKTTSAVLSFLHPDLRDELAHIDVESRAEQAFAARAGELDVFNRSLYVEARTLMPGYILSSQGDRMLMANSVEGRYPFLDHRVMEFAGRLPNRYKMNGLNEKYILKRLAENRLPESVLKRPKQPYRAPDIDALTCSTDNALMAYLDEDRILRQGVLDADKTRMMLKKVRNGRARSVKDNMIFTTLLSTQIWMEQFIHPR